MKFVKIKDVNSPERWHPSDSGIDFFIPNGIVYLLRQKQRVTIPLWIKVKLDEWTDLTFKDKSWLADNKWLTVLWWVIDNWYRWELSVVLFNTSEDIISLEGWMKVVQWVIRNVITAELMEITEDELNSTERWEGWFGSTGLLSKEDEWNKV